ncbi:Hypothetical protein A7982_00207 [Minicystis rosea]|nr:Hypothetical protein A7982_00207 [Minicystis rosea]
MSIMSQRALSISAFIAFALPLAACLAPTSDSGVDADGENVGRDGRAIIGGSKATAYPEAVLVNMKKGGQLSAYCSGALIAPKVVLTAGHCVYQFTGWDIIAPYASNQKASASSGATYDWKNAGETVNPNMHDIGLVFLDKAITLASYPTVATSPLASGASVLNIGRINNGSLSTTNLYVSKVLTVDNATSSGFPYDYIAKEVIESGDSGGPDLIPGTHTIVAVNSGAGGGTEVLARVDLLAAWIQQQVAAHGGSGSTGGTGGTGGTAGAGTGGTCSHDICSSGTKLTSTCDPCAQAICAQDAYCCSTSWDTQCMGEVASICGKTCGGTGGSGGSTSSPCGGVTFTGQCSGNTVKWCENNALQSITCTGVTHCGYDSQHGYYNCL